MNRESPFWSLKTLVTSVGCLVFAGCVYIPPSGIQFSQELQQQIHVDRSTRSEVESLLGKANRLHSDRVDIYSLQKDSGTLIFFLIGYYGMAAVPIELENEQFRVLLGYDEQGILRRREIEISTGQQLIGAGKDTGDIAGPMSNAVLALNAQGKDLLGTSVDIVFDSVYLSDEHQRLLAGGPKLVGGLLSSKRVWVEDLVSSQVRTWEVGSYDYLTVSPDFSLFALSNKAIKLVDLTTGDITGVFEGRGKNVCSLAFRPRHPQIATGDLKGNVDVWDYLSGQAVLKIRGKEGAISSLAFSPDGKFLAMSKRDQDTILWDLERGVEVVRLDGSGGTLAFSDNGSLLGINRNSHVEIWELQRLQDSPFLGLHFKEAFLLPFAAKYPPNEIKPSNKYDLDFFSDSTMLAASNGALVVLDYSSGKTLLRLHTDADAGQEKASTHLPAALSVSAGRQTLAIGTAGGVYLWNLALPD